MQDPLKLNSNLVYYYYNWEGSCSREESPNSIAKKVNDFDLGTYRYWIKRCNAGPEAGCLYNPMSSTFDIRSLNKVVNGGRKLYEYKPVSEKCFSLYLEFIRTKNTLFLKNAERF